MDDTYLSEWKPNPTLAKIASLLRAGREMGGGLGELVLSRAPEAVDRMAYGDRLTTGSGATTMLHPDILDAATLATPAARVAKAPLAGNLLLQNVLRAAGRAQVSREPK